MNVLSELALAPNTSLKMVAKIYCNQIIDEKTKQTWNNNENVFYNRIRILFYLY